MDLESIFDPSDITKSDPPLGDTTLRNPLILRVHQALNNEIPDATGHCRLMLKEKDRFGFKTGQLDEGKAFGHLMDISKWQVPHKLLDEALSILQHSIAEGVKTYRIIANVSVQQFSVPKPLLTLLGGCLMIINAVLRTSVPSKSLGAPVPIPLWRDWVLSCGSLVCEISHVGTSRIVPRDYLLMLSDCATGRLGSLFQAWLSELFSVDEVHPWYSLNRVYTAGDNILQAIGQEAYKRFKLLEAYTTAQLLTLSQGNLFPSEFPKSIQDEVAEFTDKTSVEFFMIIKELSTTPERCGDLFGLFRMWGHPILDTYKSRDRIREIAQSLKVIDHTAREFVSTSFKKHLSLGYYRRHGHWPNLEVGQLPATSELRRAVESGTSINLHSRRYRDQDWSSVSGKPTFCLPVALNLATLLADKSHSLLRSDLETTIRSTKRCGTATERRVILSFLRGSTPSIADVVSEFSRSDINKDYLVFGLREKEREVSPWARLFGLMTLPCRFYFVLTEHLLANDIVPLFPETTVGDSSIVIRKKKQQIYQLMVGDSSYLMGVINLDFEKWNLNMRYESTEPAFQFLDELYNTNMLFRNSHRIFSSSTMYLCHGIHPVFDIRKGILYPLEGENTWTDHLGGIEGLRQKGWTLLTIAVLKELADRNHVSMQLLGQGDNQVLCVRMNLLDRSEAAITTAVNKFMTFRTEVFRLFEGLALPIKSQETWSSSELFAYGKDLYYQGRRLGLRSKRASRTCFLVNDGYPSITDYIGSMASSIITLNEECHSSLVPWILYLINLRVMTYSLAWFHPTIKKGCRSCRPEYFSPGRFERSHQVPSGDIKTLFTNNRERLNKWLTVAKSPLTGIPGLCPIDLVYHGFPDTLTVSLTWASFLTSLSGYADLARSIADPLLSDNPSPLQLCEDPTSIPLLAPPVIKNRLRAIVSQYLSGPTLVKNEEFRSFLNVSLSSQLDLARSLFNIQPCNPRLMADIISATPIGQATAIVSQVSSTTTMNKLMFDYEGDRLSSRMAGLELSLLNWITYLVSVRSRSQSPDIDCPTNRARVLRKRGWGKELIGVTVPCSIHYLKVMDSPDHIPESHIIARISGCSRSLLETFRGPFPEYIGSATHEKTAKLNFPATANLGPLIQRPLKLLRLIGWIVAPTSIMATLLTNVYSASTDVPPSRFIHLFDQVSGSAEHRYEDSRTSHRLTPAGSWLASTHCLVNLSSWTEYSKGGKNKTILFQEVIVTIMKLLYEQSLFHHSSYHLTYWYYDYCSECIVDTYDGEYSLPTGCLIPTIPSFPDNNTLYLSSDRFECALPLVVRFPVAKTPLNRNCLLISYGTHLFLTGQRVTTALVDRVEPRSVIIGFTIGFVAKYLVRKILNQSRIHPYQVNLKRLSRKALLDDLGKYIPLELLLQYPSSLKSLIICFGLAAMPSDFPIGKVARRSSARILVALLLYRWATSGPFHLTCEHLLTESTISYYTEDLMTIIIVLILFQNNLQIPAAAQTALRELDVNCRTKGLSRTTSLHLILNTLANIEGCRLHESSIAALPYSFECAIKTQPLVELTYEYSPTDCSAIKTSPSTCVPLIYKRHNSELKVIYPSIKGYEETDQSFLHRIAKPFSYPTSAWYKWSGIINDSIADRSRPACLADGSGGLSRFCYDLSSITPNSRVVYFSTLPVSPDADEYSYEYMLPPILTGLPGVIGEDVLKAGVGDLTDCRTLPLLIKALQKYRPTYITCDAEHINVWRDNTRQLTLSLLKIAKQLKVPVIFKSYQQPPLLHRWQLTILVQGGVEVTELLSPYSPEKSSECFLLLRDSKPDLCKECSLGLVPSSNQNWDYCSLYSLSTSREPIFISLDGFNPPWETVMFDLHNVSSLAILLLKIIAITEEQLTSLRYFPDVGRPGVGKVQYVSSSSLAWLTLSHHALRCLETHKSWSDALTVEPMILYLFGTTSRICSTLNSKEGSHKYLIKKDTHFRNVRRRWITLLSIFEHRFN
ncbi:MAG: hypothetical protein [Barnaclevirus sp.]